MLDVHVLVCNPDKELLGVCLSSIAHAMTSAPFEVSLHVAHGEDGHIGRGRLHGYGLGYHPYITYVDPDDLIHADAFERLADRFVRPVIYCREQTLQNGHTRPGLLDHHFTVFRREYLIDHSEWAVCGDVAQLRALDGLPHTTVDTPVYTHRLYESPGRLLRRQHPEEWRLASGQLTA